MCYDIQFNVGLGILNAFWTIMETYMKFDSMFKRYLKAFLFHTTENLISIKLYSGL